MDVNNLVTSNRASRTAFVLESPTFPTDVLAPNNNHGHGHHRTPASLVRPGLLGKRVVALLGPDFGFEVRAVDGSGPSGAVFGPMFSGSFQLPAVIVMANTWYKI